MELCLFENLNFIILHALYLKGLSRKLGTVAPVLAVMELCPFEKFSFKSILLYKSKADTNLMQHQMMCKQ